MEDRQRRRLNGRQTEKKVKLKWWKEDRQRRR